MDLHAIPHEWEDHDLVVHKAHESLTDLHVEQTETLVGSGRAPSPSASEICYSSAEWTRAQVETLEQALIILGVAYDVEPGELVVDESDEHRVDALVSIITGSAPQSVQT